MANKFLDSEGLAHLWGKIKAIIPPLSNAVDSESDETAATSNAVKQAYDAAISNSCVVENVTGGLSYKFNNGLMILDIHTSVNATMGSSPVANSGFYYASVTLNLPEAFGDSNFTVTGCTRFSTGHVMPLGAFPSNNSTVLFNIYDFYSRSGSFAIHYTAIGRWK